MRTIDKPTLGMYLQAVARAAVRNQPVDARIANAPQASITGSGSTIGSEGGFLVKPASLGDLWQKATLQGELLRRLFKATPDKNSDGVILPVIDESSRVDGSRFGGVLGHWVVQGEQITASAPSIGQRKAALKKLVVLFFATDELLADANALEQQFNLLASAELVSQIEHELVVGDGARGILGLTKASARITIAKEAGQTAATIVADNVEKAIARLSPGCFRQAIWLANVDTLPQISKLTQATATGLEPLFSWGNASTGGNATLAGRPVIFHESCPTLGSEGDVILVDPPQIFVSQKGLSDSSGDLRFIFDEHVFRWTARVAGGPLWSTPLTPRQGSITQSCIVTLATRD